MDKDARIRELEIKLEIVKEKCAYMKMVHDPGFDPLASRNGPREPFKPVSITDEWLDEEYKNSKECPKCEGIMALTEGAHWCIECNYKDKESQKSACLKPQDWSD